MSWWTAQVTYLGSNIHSLILYLLKSKKNIKLYVENGHSKKVFYPGHAVLQLLSLLGSKFTQCS